MYRHTIQIYKEMYYHELNIKEMLHSRISVPLGSISAIVTIVVFMLTGAKFLEINMWVKCFFLLLGLCGISAMVSLFYLGYVIFRGNEYRYIPRPSEIEDYIWELDSYHTKLLHRDIKNRSRNEYIEQKMELFLGNEYKLSIENNLKVNEKKIRYLRYINICTTISLISGFSSAIIYYYLQN